MRPGTGGDCTDRTSRRRPRYVYLVGGKRTVDVYALVKGGLPLNFQVTDECAITSDEGAPVTADAAVFTRISQVIGAKADEIESTAYLQALRRGVINSRENHACRG